MHTPASLVRLKSSLGVRMLARAALFSTLAFIAVLAFAPFGQPRPALVEQNDPPRIIAWNDLGMHCIDPDFSVFSILPPFNNLNAQLIIDGQLVTANAANGYTVTYEGIADAHGSINSTSIGKTNFWTYVQDLFGVALAPDVGLAGFSMPGAANQPQAMAFDGNWDWYQGTGIPITPIDDAFAKNPYPLMKVVVRDSGGRVISETVTVVPNSSELQCAECHGSGASPKARPQAGWTYSTNPSQDDRFNILRLHDERRDPATYPNQLSAVGYDPAGLFATVTGRGVPINCSRCHGSNALPGTGVPGIPPFTQAMHRRHATVENPSGTTLGTSELRSACYSCHPGYDTQCLRGAMGSAIGSDGEYAMQCQSCHGKMADVGDPNRVGWLDQANCQACHSGTATQNSGEIRYDSAFDVQGHLRQPANDTFATTPDVPAAGFSLYRFSTGHGGLQCSACHGPPHAIYPTPFANDNMQNELLQGHKGTLSDCSVCHFNREDNQLIGPHGMHPATAQWAGDKHGDLAERDIALCRSCHGADGRGTVLSLAQDDRSFNTRLGSLDLFRGAQVGCYHCHDGPGSERPTTNRAPSVNDLQFTTPNDRNQNVALNGIDPDGNPLSYRIISQPEHGRVAISGAQATYKPVAGFLGTVEFTYAAWDGKTNSNLGHVTIQVGPPVCNGTTENYGFGCPGAGDFTPRLQVEGAPCRGETLSLAIDRGLGGASALVLVGGDRGLLELPHGCVLRITPLLTSFPPISLIGNGPGAGSIQVPIAIPAGLVPGSLTLQALIVDPSAPNGWTLTNAVAITTG